MKGFVRIITGAVIAAVIFGAGCSHSIRPAVSTSVLETRPSKGVLQLERDEVGNGVIRVRYRFSTSTETAMEVYGFPGDAYAFRLATTGTRLGMKEWADAFPDARAIVNGGYFMDDLTPSGFFVMDGKRIGGSLFDFEKSGLVIVDGGRLRIVNTSGTSSIPDGYSSALQSYPFLVKNGASSVASDSGKRARRSFVGTDREGMAWIGVVSNGEVSLYELSRALTLTDIPWENVMNLDGGPSTGLYVNTEKVHLRNETYTGIPNVIYVDSIK